MNIPGTCLGTLTSPVELPELSEADIESALLNPTWSSANGPSVFNIATKGDRICFVVSDHTRKTATDLVLPLILRRLIDNGCSVDDVSVLVASGTHRPPTKEEIKSIIGPEPARILEGRIFCHDADDQKMLVSIGTLKDGHPVLINRRAVDCDRLVLIGSATYHYHAGFGGGRKSLVPGLADRATIAHTHSRSLDPSADRMDPDVDIGKLDGNPVAELMMEAALLHPPSIIVNTVVSPEGKLIGVFSGDMDLAHRQACALVEKTCRVDINELADIVIASAEGAPNWIQSHKALYNASRAVKPDGIVILTAPCPEGLGNERFRYWLKKSSTPEFFAELRKSAEVNGQTALSTRIRGNRAILITCLDDTDRKDLGIPSAPDVNTAVQLALAKLNKEPSHYLMPNARYTVPFCEGQT